MPASSAVFGDARGGDRTMRISHHPEQGLVVVSLWLGPMCRSSFRLPADQVDGLVAALAGAAEPASTEPTPAPPVPAANPVPGTGAVDSTAVTAAAEARSSGSLVA